jgi:hypothetical protein
MDVRKARMSLFGEKRRKEKQKQKDIGEGTVLPFPERFELRGEISRWSEICKFAHKLFRSPFQFCESLNDFP